MARYRVRIPELKIDTEMESSAGSAEKLYEQLKQELGLRDDEECDITTA